LLAPVTPIHQSRIRTGNESGCTALNAEMADFARLVGAALCPVLLEGETGSGKTHLARLIHQSSPRARGPFVRVNCGAIPDSLFERELFGHVRGAFTDARDNGAGFLEAAHGGTLFLDEIGELPLQLQPKLLAVLEDGVFRKLGSPRETTVDVHVIAATNRDLTEMVRLKQFREDLYYRFSVLRYRVPPLRERREEIPELVHRLLLKTARRGEAPELTPAAMRALTEHDWPGNVRELDNALRAALLFTGGGPVDVEHLPSELRVGGGRTVEASGCAVRAERYCAPPEPAREVEMIRRALEEAGGNKTAAARALGMSRTTLWTKLYRYGVVAPG
jgi:DNA-binding NtrC family response regulator